MTQEFSDELLIARVLHYVIQVRGKLKCRAAIVVEDWGGGEKVNLVVFPDGSNDEKYGIDDHSHRVDGTVFPTGPANVPLLNRWETSISPDHNKKTVGTWHWPRECSRLS